MVHDSPDAVEALNRYATTSTAIIRVVQANLTIDRMFAAFIPFQIWSRPGGYGPFRARSILTGVLRRTNVTAPLDE